MSEDQTIRVAGLLKSAGWRDNCDAQWTGLEKLLPELRDALGIAHPAAQAVPDKWRDALQGLVDDIQGLINESYGVSGLHMNGYTARWGELLPGGRFERLTYLAVAGELLAAAQPAAQAVPDITALVDRFLSWPLPESFCAYPHRTWANLMNSEEARAMLEHLLSAAPTPPAAYDDGYYIQSHHGYVGNCPLWWRKGGGYTTHIDEAEVLTEEAANELLSGLSGRNDKPWPVSVVRAAATLQVDMQRLRDTQPSGGCLVADRKMSLHEARQWVEELGPEYRLPSSEELK